MQIPVEIAGIATGSHPCDPAAGRDMLDIMMRRLPFAASCLAVYDPLEGAHRTIASVGYDDGVLAYLNGRFASEDVAYSYYQRLGRGQRALKWSEMPFNYRGTYSVQEVFMPAGYREGVTLCLYSRDGRYTGNLHVSTDDERFPSLNTMSDTIQCLQTILGNYTDLLREVSSPYIGRFKNGSGYILVNNGATVALPGIPWTSDELQEHLRPLFLSAVTPDVFLYKKMSVWYRIFTGLMQGGARVILVEEAEVPYGLTFRELQIIELLISGATNNEIAASTFVARSTVSKHLENIFEKLSCNSRTAVVSTALVQNLRHVWLARSQI